MIIAVTGHRGIFPETRLIDLAEAALSRYTPKRVYTGMALGWDMAIAEACVLLEIDYVACLPFPQQADRWSIEQQSQHRDLIDLASHVWTGNDEYARDAFNNRNKYMIDSADQVLALWDGRRTGGTHHAVMHANFREIPVHNLWASWTRYKEA
ncbi:MAG: DUF1273 family protein [Desulfobacterales bacterium]|nr:DUF1273 family protein [Desulfobacterales bacterium]